MRYTSWWMAILVACDGGTSGDPGDDDGPEDTEVTTDSGMDSGTVPDEPECYADWTYDRDDDGTVDGAGIDIYDPARTDLLVHMEREYGYGLRFSADYTYDAEGNATRFSYDVNDDGSDDYIVTNTYDASGNTIQSEIDDDGDKVPDETWWATYDADGNLLTFEHDQDGDETVDYAYQYVRDENGRRISATEDQDGDGVTDRWFTYTYDDAGRQIEAAADAGNDGTIDYLVTTTYTDPVLFVGTTVIDDGNDGILEEIEVFENDASNRLVYIEEDFLADSIVDHIHSYVYDTATGVLVEEDHEGRDPPPDDANTNWWHNEYQYDTLLRLVDQYEEDGEVVDGVEDESVSREAWTFGGTCP